MYTVERVSIQISKVEEQKNAERELKSSDTVARRGGYSTLQYVPIQN